MQVTDSASKCVCPQGLLKDHHAVNASGSDKADGPKPAAAFAKWTEHCSARKELDLLDTNSPSNYDPSALVCGVGDFFKIYL